MHARDRLGRRVATGSPEAVAEVPEQALEPAAALDLAQELLDAGRAFGAHEVLEACWKAAPSADRELWQSLAQLCVGVTHVQRGNAVGGARLLRRGGALLPVDLPYGLDGGLATWAAAAAAVIEAGDLTPPALRLRRG